MMTTVVMVMTVNLIVILIFCASIYNVLSSLMSIILMVLLN